MAKRGLCMTQTGTPYYASPEVIWVAGHWDGSLKCLYYDTVDGSEIRRSPVEVGSLSHYLQGFIHSRWCRINSINSIILNCSFYSIQGQSCSVFCMPWA